MQPATLIAQTLTLGSLGSALVMPIAGAVIDLSPYRLALGRASCACLLGLFALQVRARLARGAAERSSRSRFRTSAG